MNKGRPVSLVAIMLWTIATALYAAGKIYKPDMSNCAGFTTADAATILNVPASAITAKTVKVHDSLWTCAFTAGKKTLNFSVELSSSAEEAAAGMARYRENLEIAAKTAPFKDKLPNGAWSEITPLGDENTWTDVNHTLSVRLGNVTIQVQAPQEKLQQVKAVQAFLKKL